MSLYSSLSVSPEEPRRTTRGVRVGVDSPLESSGGEEEPVDILMRELRESARPSHDAPQVQMAPQERANQDPSLLALQEENRGQKQQIQVLDLKLKDAEKSHKTSEGNLLLARQETARLKEVVLQRDAALQQVQKHFAQPGEQISKLEGELGRSQEAVRSFREQLEQEQRQRSEAGGKVQQMLGINAHLKDQVERDW